MSGTSETAIKPVVVFIVVVVFCGTGAFLCLLRVCTISHPCARTPFLPFRVCRYKQRGPYLPGVPPALGTAAVDACNVFFHLMYEGAVDLQALREENEPLYLRVLALVDNYGQIAPQLMTEPHPRRLEPRKCETEYPVFSLANSECRRCCPMMGLELYPERFQMWPMMLMPWPREMPVAIHVHNAPVIFVAKSEKHVRGGSNGVVPLLAAW